MNRHYELPKSGVQTCMEKLSSTLGGGEHIYASVFVCVYICMCVVFADILVRF